ncbi:C1 family peptidase [Methylocystis echinoides]|uniref:Peptidase C1A papain C-terminal domain-containing protein n=1 Tax=Methylocystis echinoides TaxID=29468 RepID=A0A9W6GX74_9HYPH|nr:C1 family peptidase [Methylocystis echinoides]GLI94682.1 hypothetical protein LMG27198_36740 [Methylocystis echinoides]
MIALEEINRAIEKNARGMWVAGNTAAWRRGVQAGDSAKTMFGLRVGDEDRRLRAAAESIFEELTVPAPPRSIDWRTDAGGRVGPVKDQGQCGACVAFATCAAMESLDAIRTHMIIQLSEGHLFHCGGGSCTDGWEFVPALEMAKKGVGRQADLPWDPDGACVAILPSVRITGYKVHVATVARKRAVAVGPVLAGMKVYEDFLAYRTGVYRHVAGQFSGNHAVCVVGYDDDVGCWIVKNSWGLDFGEAGFFRIAYGECGIDSDFAFYSIEVDGCRQD